jgi:hypothetical protein
MVEGGVENGVVQESNPEVQAFPPLVDVANPMLEAPPSKKAYLERGNDGRAK